VFITTIAALLYTSYNLLSKVFTGQVVVAAGQTRTEALIGNGLMGFVALFLVVAAFMLLIDGLKALKHYRQQPAAMAPETK